MIKEERIRLKELKGEINSPKSRLIETVRKIEEISPRQAKILGSIIGRLEDFQNK